MRLIIDETVLLFGNSVKLIYFKRRTLVYYALKGACFAVLFTKRCSLHVFKQMTVYPIIKPTDNQSEELEICPWFNRFLDFGMIRTSSLTGIRNCLIVFSAFSRAN